MGSEDYGAHQTLCVTARNSFTPRAFPSCDHRTEVRGLAGLPDRRLL